jgi:hypothetical protein
MCGKNFAATRALDIPLSSKSSTSRGLGGGRILRIKRAFPKITVDVCDRDGKIIMHNGKLKGKK